MSGATVEQETNLRPSRSRKDRPCDYCRSLKHVCRITTRGEPCANCSKTNRECTFYDPPRKRRRESAAQSPEPGSSDGPDISRRGSGGAGDFHNETLHPIGISVAGCSRTSSYQGGIVGNSVAVSQESRKGTALSGFLECLDEDEVQDQILEDNIDYPSLDAENNDEEESHYLGSRAFAHLVLTSPHAGSSITSSVQTPEKLHYRQVADPKNPAYFLRNPSRVYGESNHAFVAEKAYQMVYDFLRDINPGYPHKMVQIFLQESLPAFPILNRARLEAACFNPQAPMPFPYTVLTGILTHAAAHMPDLRPRIRELWKIVLSLEDNEYRQPRLQTLQITLLDIWGRPCSSPGFNHTSLCRAIGTAQLLGLHRNCDKWKLPKWERSVRKRIWWTLYVFDKWNAFVYGRPSNITTHVVPIPTARDADPGAPLDVFIASCRLACILDTLLPILGCDTRESVDHRRLVHQAAEQLEALDGDITLRHGEPGSCSYRLDYLGVQVLICRIGLDEAGDLSLKRLDKVAVNVLAVAEEVVEFLDSLTADDYMAFWAPWSSFHISHTASLVLQTCLKIHQSRLLSSDPPVPGDTCITTQLLLLLRRLIMTTQKQASEEWEIAESSLLKLRRLIHSIPDINNPVLPEIRAMITPPAELGVSAQQDLTSAEFPFDFATLLNSAEWLAPGLEWMNAIPAPTALNPMTMIGNGNGIRNGLLPPLLPTPTPLPLPMPMPTRPQLPAPGQVMVPAMLNSATMTPIQGVDNGFSAELPTNTGQLGERIWM